MTDKITTNKPTIEQLEKMLDSDEEPPIQILPDGTVVIRAREAREQKPLTFRENLGGEYAVEAKQCE